MQTKIIKINTNQPEEHKIKIASDIIKDGRIVAFPTETVYGLGADALNEIAVGKIFKAKRRPADNPLIVHISHINQINNLVREIPKIFYKLADEFWPGPLTLILKKSLIVPKNVSAGLDSVALRMPKNKIALELIKSSGPIAAPSANISSKPSGTSVKHVIQDFKGRIPLIINGGETKIGLESTVVNLTSSPPMLLRPGKITLEQLKKFIPNIKLYVPKKAVKKAHSPGMKYKHYSPSAKVIIANNKDDIYRIKEEFNDKRIKVIDIDNVERLAKNMFKWFREADEGGYEIIIVKRVKPIGLGLAVMNRLERASIR